MGVASKTHLPGYVVAAAEEMKIKGVEEEILCVSVNDLFGIEVTELVN